MDDRAEAGREEQRWRREQHELERERRQTACPNCWNEPVGPNGLGVVCHAQLTAGPADLPTTATAVAPEVDPTDGFDPARVEEARMTACLGCFSEPIASGQLGLGCLVKEAQASAVDTLGAEVEQRSRGVDNAVFHDVTLAAIGSRRDDKGQLCHPLRFLLGESGSAWLSTSPVSDDLPVHAGHLVSRFAGREERFAVEDAGFNVSRDSSSERAGAVLVKSAVDVDGIPVELRTARLYVALGLLDQAYLTRPSPGWSRSGPAPV